MRNQFAGMTQAEAIEASDGGVLNIYYIISSRIS